MSALIWSIKLKYVGTRAGYQVDIEGQPGHGMPINLGWVRETGRGPTPAAAYRAATAKLVVKPWLVTPEESR